MNTFFENNGFKCQCSRFTTWPSTRWRSRHFCWHFEEHSCHWSLHSLWSGRPETEPFPNQDAVTCFASGLVHFSHDSTGKANTVHTYCLQQIQHIKILSCCAAIYTRALQLLSKVDNLHCCFLRDFAINAGASLIFIQHATSVRQLTTAQWLRMWGIFQRADAPLRYRQGLLCSREREYGIAAKKVHQHSVVYRERESKDETRRKSDGGTDSQLFFFSLLKIAHVEWVTQWPLRWGYSTPENERRQGRRWENIRGGCACSLRSSLSTGRCLGSVCAAHCFI